MELRWLIKIVDDEDGEESTKTRVLQYQNHGPYGTALGWRDVPVRTEIYHTEEDGTQKLVEVKETL